MWGWISWCNSLSYETLLHGVPGTGTRKDGLEGIMLKVNMDGIVLLRYQALCLRMCAIITVLCIFVILPLNLTARCNYSEGSYAPQECFDSSQTNLTNYDVTTLANIPDLANGTSTLGTVTLNEYSATMGRLYAIVFCTWIIYYASCRSMYWEWKTLLALRRVYYLEKDHWAERRRELEDSLLRSRIDDEDGKSMENRNPWIPVSLSPASVDLVTGPHSNTFVLLQ